TAKFKDEANYIRIYTPGNDYIRIHSNEYNNVFNIRPKVLLRKKTLFNNVLSRFSDRFAYRIKQKNTLNDFSENLNPFEHGISDTNVINYNSTLRNTFSFNRTSPKFSVDYIFQKNNSKIQLMNGSDIKSRSYSSIRFRWNVFKSIILINNLEQAKKKYESEFFPTKNYNIHSFINDFTLEYQPGLRFDIDFKFKYADKENVFSTENADIYNLGAVFKFNSLKKGNILCKANFIKIEYNALANTSLAYEMLEGLKPGKNSTWEIVFQHRISSVFDISILYSGRAPANSSIIHTGSVQIRAGF
ncbi:MAG: hypothetical protein U9R54_04470, partial [Bacteroidota bacterium]|nr:hypothetical protein [Bacteroidota bacterium]